MRYVPYRFPLLACVSSGPAPDAETCDGATQRDRALSDACEETRREASERGYQEGFSAGEKDGRDAGFTRGYDEGRRRGSDESRRDVAARFDGVAQTADMLVDSLKKLQSECTAAMQTALIKLVEKVVHQVIRAELTLQPSQLIALIDEAIATMPPVTDGIEIYLNPEECDRIAALSPERAKRWNLIPDNRLESGECRIKAGPHEVDAGCRHRLETCLAQVREQLESACETDVESDSSTANDKELTNA
ncbi:flagellar assembly protein FliH [Burkholderia ubonensis]|uniref:flagellar assembly protein FliH n=1 Tax=Burkholderia ubonensis TaxID=101571 RepID=UPI00076CBA3F|nr:flagellar assembly protein FliH [Burkholderia ubonensis]KWB79408.1 hypothetical protein WL42_12665 [Burkholderia ubonensis]